MFGDNRCIIFYFTKALNYSKTTIIFLYKNAIFKVEGYIKDQIIFDKGELLVCFFFF